jgi:hypothetical protein
MFVFLLHLGPPVRAESPNLNEDSGGIGVLALEDSNVLALP